MESIRSVYIENDLDGGRIHLASVAHELRTPLAAIVSAATVLRGVVGTHPTGVAALELLQRQAQVLTRLVGDLVDTAWIETGQLSSTFEVLDLKEVLSWAAGTCEPAMRARGHSYQALLFEGPLPVVADRDRLVQVFVNLLNNAIKYTPRGGKISLIATAEGEEAVVSVRDNGVGMSSNTLPLLFKRFSQGPVSRSMANGGVGIGLALVRSILTMHEGTVEARSEGHDQGSEFTVRLPLHEPSSPSSSALRYRVLHATIPGSVDPRSPMHSLA